MTEESLLLRGLLAPSSAQSQRLPAPSPKSRARLSTFKETICPTFHIPVSEAMEEDGVVSISDEDSDTASKWEHPEKTCRETISP